ncbi:hypothetical protein Ciccas_011330 [Cichlidogyrus casuarinus]|uniref:Uncharacterized protein n=1 Tax=Cichlidogyrus casuarinus TaxID=1844966 RepID=A0ABD2PSR8_9PLAT
MKRNSLPPKFIGADSVSVGAQRKKFSLLPDRQHNKRGSSCTASPKQPDESGVNIFLAAKDQVTREHKYLLSTFSHSHARTGLIYYQDRIATHYRQTVYPSHTTEAHLPLHDLYLLAHFILDFTEDRFSINPLTLRLREANLLLSDQQKDSLVHFFLTQYSPS